MLCESRANNPKNSPCNKPATLLAIGQRRNGVSEGGRGSGRVAYHNICEGCRTTRYAHFLPDHIVKGTAPPW